MGIRFLNLGTNRPCQSLEDQPSTKTNGPCWHLWLYSVFNSKYMKVVAGERNIDTQEPATGWQSCNWQREEEPGVLFSIWHWWITRVRMNQLLDSLDVYKILRIRGRKVNNNKPSSTHISGNMVFKVQEAQYDFWIIWSIFGNVFVLHFEELGSQKHPCLKHNHHISIAYSNKGF